MASKANKKKQFQTKKYICGGPTSANLASTGSTPVCDTPIAIVGMAFRFPGDCNDEASFWGALKNKRDLVTQVPAQRWAVNELQHPNRSEPGRSITYAAGVLSRIDEFDAAFFGVSPREAAWLDPQQRLLLELSWEAMENAGVPASTLKGSNCAVYVGIAGLDYGTRGLDDLASLSSHTMTGNTLSVAANRLSYVFDLRGPSLAVDTACSSSLVALHHACRCLQLGEAGTALVGGVNLLLHPYSFVGFTKASMLSASGRCRPFDAAGDGYVRSEGSAVILLKPLAQAQADGDTIEAVILASGINADGGRKTGITIPSCQGQSDLMRQVLAKSGLASSDVDFIEAHGTGTPVGDPVEASAIGQVYGQGRGAPLPIGSVKGNVGHLEAASGMAGLIKAVLALKNGALPPALHLDALNPNIDFAALNLNVPTRYQPLPITPGKPLVAGVNSFGFGGANAHVLLQQAPASTSTLTSGTAPAGLLAPLYLSARTDAALRELAQRYADRLAGQSRQGWYDMAYAAAHGRDQLEKRLVLQPRSVAQAITQLHAYGQGDTAAAIICEEGMGSQLAFVYAGNGAQWVGMGCTLLAESPRFAAVLADLDQAMQPAAGFSVLAQLQSDTAQSKLDDTTVAQPLLFAIQVAITLLLREQGIVPTAVTGHSVGEIAAAWACGALSLDQSIRVICARSQAQGLTRGSGKMAAVGMSVESVQRVMANHDGNWRIEFAGFNSPDSVTLSGNEDDLLRLQAILEPRGVFFRVLDLDYAFHSHHMDHARQALDDKLGGLYCQRPVTATFVSTVTGEVINDDALDAEYWWRNIRQPVQFAKAINGLAQQGCRVFVEITPHGILQHYLRKCLGAAGVQASVLATCQRGNDSVARLADTAWRLRLLTSQLGQAVFFPHKGAAVRLPNYPWQREPYWHPQTTESLHAITRYRQHPLLGWRIPGADLSWENVLDPVALPWLADHRVGGAVVFPGAAYAEMALAAGGQWYGDTAFTVDQLNILLPMVFDGKYARTVRLTVDAQDGRLRISSRQRLSDDKWVLHAVGHVLECSTSAAFRPQPIVPPAPPSQSITHDKHYQLASSLGLDYGAAFRGMRSVQVGPDSIHAHINVPDAVALDGYILHPGLFDLGFQLLLDFSAHDIESGRGSAMLPVKIGHLAVYSNNLPVTIRARLIQRGKRSAVVDIQLLDVNHVLVAAAQQVRLRAVPLLRQDTQAVAHWQITPRLEPHSGDQQLTQTPSVASLVKRARVRLFSLQGVRRTWFRETLPLSEALVLSFVYEACLELELQEPRNWHDIFGHADTTPYVRWLGGLMRDEGLLAGDGNTWSLAGQADLPPVTDLWRSLLCDTPTYMPHLTLMAHVGCQLPALLAGKKDVQALWQQVRQSPLTQAIFHDDPTCLGVRHVLEDMLGRLARDWPQSQRLRVLEVAVGASTLPATLAGALPEDHFDYVLALPEGSAALAQAGGGINQPSVQVVAFDIKGFELPGDLQAQPFNVVLLRHSLNFMADPGAALSWVYQRLAAGGIVCVAERYPDFSACFLRGLNSGWWHQNPHDAASPVSPLRGPEGWQAQLVDAGFAQVTSLTEPSADDLAEGAYVVLAKSTSARSVLPVQANSWQLLADQASDDLAQALQQTLVEHGQMADVIVASPWNSDEATAASPTGASTDHKYRHVVYMRGWGALPEQAASTCTDLLRVVQQMGGVDPALQLWVLAQGGACTTGLPANYIANAVQSALWGLGRVVMNEAPQLNCTLIDMADVPALHVAAARVSQELLRPDGQTEIILSQSGRYGLALHAAISPTTDNVLNSRCRLDFAVPGRLTNLAWLPDTEQPLRAHEIEVSTRATGVNFRDVMYLMGLLPDEAVENGFAGASLGLEFSGVVSRVGADVPNFKPGDAVMGFGASCFASHVVTPASAVAKMPNNWSFEAAATVPTVFLTVYYALAHLANLQPGERVLIHGATGGVGIAALQLARHLDAEIFATAGTPEKRDFVRMLGADHVFDSRSLAFENDVRQVTDGQGVDVVLNSLAGEAMRRSIGVLRPFGRFLELGKRDFFENTALGLRPFKNNISYFGIDADQLLIARPELAKQLFEQVIALFADQALAPLPYQVFQADQVVDAFRLMQQARHIGKVVVRAPTVDAAVAGPKSSNVKPLTQHTIDASGTWLVTGGLSGFGLESARWLANKGVKHLVLIGRRGAQTPGADQAVSQLTQQGVHVQVRACNVTSLAAVAEVVDQIKCDAPELKGVLHAAAVFKDGLLGQLSADDMATVVNTKLLGAWNLHQATLGCPVEHFIVYSSITTAIGNPGQANYVAANCGLEGLTQWRRQQGLPATCVAWGPISDTGYLTRNEAVKNSLQQRLGKPPLTASQALNALEQVVLGPPAAQTHVLANFDWNTLACALPSANASRFALLNRNRLGVSAQTGSVRDLIRGHPADTVLKIVQGLVTQEVAQTLIIAPERVDLHRPLHDMGLDSLMAVELALGLEQRFGIQLPVMMINDAPTVSKVATRIVARLTSHDGADTQGADADPALGTAAMVSQHGEGFSPQELHALTDDAQKLVQSGTTLIP